MSKLLLIWAVLMFGVSVVMGETFYLKDASRKYDVKIEVAECADGFCRGAIAFSLFAKNSEKPFQIIKLADTEFLYDEAEMTDTKLRYDYQSIVFFEDYNFDGHEDLALRDGNNGGYGGPSYQVYLFAPTRRKFVSNAKFTELAQGAYLGMFEVDKKRKVLRNFSKSGCCWHQTQEFTVSGNRPKMVYELTEDATGAGKVKIITKRFVKGKWQTRVKYVSREG